MLAQVSNESLQLFLIFLAKDVCTALYIYMQLLTFTYNYILTAANLSKRANSSLRVITSSCAVHCDARLVKPSMSANKMLQKHKDKRDRIHSEKRFSHSLNSLY